MSEQLIDLLKFGLLALLYLFFLRVIWTVWTELKAPATEPQVAPRRAQKTKATTGTSRGGRTRSKRKQASELQVLEPAELAGGRYPLAAEMTVGRAPGCTIVIDDTFVSQLHARVFVQNGRPQIEDLGSTNGTHHNGAEVSGPQPLALGDQIRVGNLVLEVA